ncbi:MAG: hypothetical protein EBT61_11990 [Verrucomicrobia bacterium]|nr:hypothetical protein [Verrucomicrobiota bacterium]
MTTSDWLTQPEPCLELVTRLTALGAAVCAGEFIAMRRMFANDGLLGWPLLRQFSRLSGDGLLARALEACFGNPGILVVFWAWLLVALSLATVPSHLFWRPVAVTFLFIVHMLLNVRHFSIATTGADRLRLVTLGALTLREMAPDSELLSCMTLLFIGANCVLAYFVAGLYRLASVAWRTGRGLSHGLRLPLSGDEAIAGWLESHPRIDQLLTWGVEALEIGFPLTLLGGPVTVLPGLVLFLLMHLLIGHLMGLSRFLWAFPAAYPAVVYTSVKLHSWLFHS